MLKVTNTKKAPAAIGPYSQAVGFGNILFTSGQIPLDPSTVEVVGSNIEEQATQVMKNISAILEANDINFENVIKTTCFIANMSDFASFNEVYAKYFISNPARSCVAVKELPKGVLCEVEVIAFKNV
ncbi:RidA family protein [Clostridium diolis]|uniref:RidA family protein n=1 Tax=Clostridium diolis TaxID=223919 RepID=UPI003AF55501